MLVSEFLTEEIALGGIAVIANEMNSFEIISVRIGSLRFWKTHPPHWFRC
jgi:hypothetical protein